MVGIVEGEVVEVYCLHIIGISITGAICAGLDVEKGLCMGFSCGSLLDDADGVWLGHNPKRY